MPSMGCQGLFAIGSHELLRVMHSWQGIGYSLSSLPSVSNTQSGAVMPGPSDCTPHSSQSVFGYYWHCQQLLWILRWLSRAEDAVSGFVKGLQRDGVFGLWRCQPTSTLAHLSGRSFGNPAIMHLFRSLPPLQELTSKFLKRCISVCTL